MYLIKSPFWLKWLYPNLVWNKSRFEKCIYLSFDDGPIPIVTPFVIKTLKEFNVKATFFCIGDNIKKHPEIYAKLIADKHTIGNHTYNHLKGWNTDNRVYLDNMLKCDELTHSTLFRPPYGRIKKSQIKQLKAAYQKQYPDKDLEIIMWDVLSGDFDTRLSPQDCLKNILRHTENGSIVVFHDSAKAYDRLKYALPKALETWTAQGYSFKAL